MSAYRERTYTSQDNLRLFFRDYGDPLAPLSPVLCLPGLTRNCKDFATLADRLSRSRRVVCPDYRGRGRSDHDPYWRNYTPSTYLADIHHLLAAAGLDQVVVIGTSLGGLLGMALAVWAPKALPGLVLNDIGPQIEPAEQHRLLTLISVDAPQPNWDAAVAALRDMFPGLAFRQEATWMTMAKNTWRQGDDGKLHFDWDVRLARPMLRGTEALPDPWRLYGALRHIPVLALRGENSSVLSKKCFDRMAALKPDLARVTVAGTAHTPDLNEPEAETAIDDFLRRI
mgnify:CR=1 FL=1